jgi:hypothetical protein
VSCASKILFRKLTGTEASGNIKIKLEHEEIQCQSVEYIKMACDRANPWDLPINFN